MVLGGQQQWPAGCILLGSTEQGGSSVWTFCLLLDVPDLHSLASESNRELDSEAQLWGTPGAIIPTRAHPKESSAKSSGPGAILSPGLL